MKTLSALVIPMVALFSPLAVGQRPNAKPLSESNQATVCTVFDDPSGYNNTLVKVRGYVEISFEYSLLLDERCPEKAIWFAFGDGSSTPQVRAYVNGRGQVGGMDSKGRRTPPMPITLVKNKSFIQLTHYLELSAKGAACADGPPAERIPDCATYRVWATFSGRIDGVSKQLHAAHMKHSNFEKPDGKGFGHMGMFDAQIVVRSVENVGAVYESNLHDATARSGK